MGQAKSLGKMSQAKQPGSVFLVGFQWDGMGRDKTEQADPAHLLQYSNGSEYCVHSAVLFSHFFLSFSTKFTPLLCVHSMLGVSKNQS